MEIERKFVADENLVDEFLKSTPHTTQSISQYYIKIGKVEERFRQKNQQFFHTIKKDVDGLSREEYETECSPQEFEQNKIYMIGSMVEKTRYVAVYNNHTLEIDKYLNNLQGLCICETEFKTVAEAKKFVAPFFCVCEVTTDNNFKNQCLGMLGMPVDLYATHRPTQNELL